MSLLHMQALQQAIVATGGPNIAIPYIGLLILGIVLAILGWAIGKATPRGQPLWTIMFWLGIACIIIWIILLILSVAFGFVCC